jgi:DHA1 family tetracycline resistance protein-like MFS transporter
MTNLFAFFTQPSAPVYFPGAPFLLASVIMAVSGVLAYFALRAKADPLPPAVQVGS